MVAIQLLAAFFTLATPLLVRADVQPDEPSPGSVYNAGASCKVTWEADKDSTTDWKDMSIQLMCGDNLNMIHITTVASGQDGTKDGVFTYTCPEVDPNAPIYFYQFSSARATNHTWTTRFTIASASGEVVAAPNANQPDGSKIAWGVGSLVDPSTATPPPAWVNDSSAGNSTTSASSSSSSKIPSSTSSRMLASATPVAAAANSTSSSTVGAGSGAFSSSVIDTRLLFGAGAFLAAMLM